MYKHPLGILSLLPEVSNDKGRALKLSDGGGTAALLCCTKMF